MIAQTLTNSFKLELLEGVHNFLVDTFKIALYTSSATIDATTPSYTASNEVVGTGYTAGGQVLTGTSVQSFGPTAVVDFDNVVWAAAGITCRGALIYNSSKSNKSVCVLDFGADKTSVNTFTIEMPAASATTALIRIV